jgi:MFS family permease
MVEKKEKIEKQEDSPKVKRLKEKARFYSIKEGIFASSKNAFGDSYISPFAIGINMSNPMIAGMGAISGLLGPLSQIFGSRLIEKYPRKKIILRTVLIESLIWIPMILVAILFYKGILPETLPLLLLITFSFYIIIANISSPAWFSWMGDIIPEQSRGRFFARRNFIVGFISIILGIGSAFFLEFMKTRGELIQGFILFFILAFFSRLMCWKVFKKKYEPELKLEKRNYFSIKDFLLKARHNNFGKFSIFRAFFSFAVSISAPLFVIYLLRELNFSYPIYMAVVSLTTIFSIFSVEIWGKFADKYGNYKTLILTSFIISTVPFVWTISKSPLFWIFIPPFFGGIGWAGFNLASGNFIYDNVSQQKRGLAISYHNVLIGIGTFLGAGLGAILIQNLKTTIIQPLIIIFIISGFCRFFVVLLWINKINEVKKKRKFEGTNAIKNLILKGVRPTISEEIHQIMTIKKYLRK